MRAKDWLIGAGALWLVQALMPDFGKILLRIIGTHWAYFVVIPVALVLAVIYNEDARDRFDTLLDHVGYHTRVLGFGVVGLAVMVLIAYGVATPPAPQPGAKPKIAASLPAQPPIDLFRTKPTPVEEPERPKQSAKWTAPPEPTADVKDWIAQLARDGFEEKPEAPVLPVPRQGPPSPITGLRIVADTTIGANPPVPSELR
jgi:hypothetical protein